MPPIRIFSEHDLGIAKGADVPIEEAVSNRETPVTLRPFAAARLAVALLGLAWLGVAVAAAATPPPIVPGATKEEVVGAFGVPKGQTRAGGREILTYAEGRVVLENGRVEQMDFPSGYPVRPTDVPAPALEGVSIRIDEAKREAARRHVPILAVCNDPDASIAARRFQDEVAFHPDFVSALRDDFVFLRLDFSSRVVHPEAEGIENAQLRERLGIASFPTLLVMSEAAAVLQRIELPAMAADDYRAAVVTAVRRARDKMIAAAVAENVVVPPEPPPEPVADPETPEQSSAGWAMTLVLKALGIGLLVSVALWWLLTRARFASTVAPSSNMAERIAVAASGLPTAAEIAAWPKSMLYTVVAGLATEDGYEPLTRRQRRGDLLLCRRGEEQPAVLVSCHTGAEGVIALKRVREFRSAMNAENVELGWLVAPEGFSKEARDFAREHHLRLVDGVELLEQMREAPPILLRTILTRMA
jgi:hypothetical protein